MSLAAPADDAWGLTVKPGRLYLAADPGLLRLADPREGFDAQFVLMPFPNPSRYLRDAESLRYTSLDDKNRRLTEAFTRAIEEIRADTPVRPVAADRAGGPHLGDGRGRVEPVPAERRPGHRHGRGQGWRAISPMSPWATSTSRRRSAAGTTFRYSGSIERMDLGEKQDTKSVAVFDLGPAGVRGPVTLLPLPATPVYEVDVLRGRAELDDLKTQYADAAEDLISLHINYTAGENLEDLLRQLDKVFPRWYARDWRETGELGQSLTVGEADRTRTFEEVVTGYLEKELTNHSVGDRTAVLNLARGLMGLAAVEEAAESEPPAAAGAEADGPAEW